MISEKLKVFIICSFMALFASINVKATDDCFEGLSRSVFKFNMVLDDIVLEPMQKVTINYLTQLRQVQVILHRIYLHFFPYQIHCYKGI